MEKIDLFGAAAGMLAVSAGMALFEWSRIRNGRPILKGHEVMALYWVAYLSLFVLGVTTAIAAIVR